MLKKYVKLLIQIVFVFGAYMILSEYVSDIVLLVGFVSNIVFTLIVGEDWVHLKPLLGFLFIITPVNALDLP